MKRFCGGSESITSIIGKTLLTHTELGSVNKRDKIGRETVNETDWPVFIHIITNPKEATPYRRQKWATFVAEILQGLWDKKFGQRSFKFESDHTPDDPGKRRTIGEIIIATEAMCIAQRGFSNNTLAEILHDDDALGCYFPESRFASLREYYMGSERPGEADVKNILKRSEWQIDG